jgi:hypothetical protein
MEIRLTVSAMEYASGQMRLTRYMPTLFAEIEQKHSCDTARNTDNTTIGRSTVHNISAEKEGGGQVRHLSRP